MRVLVRRAYSGWGYLASAAGPQEEPVHAVGFDEAVVEFASKQPELCELGGTLRLEDLAVTLVEELYGQYVLEVTRR